MFKPLFVFVFLFSFQSQAEIKLNWILAYNPAIAQNINLINKTVENIKSKTKNRVIIQTMAMDSKTTGRNRMAIQGLESGNYQIAMLSSGGLASVKKKFGIFDLVGLLKSDEEIKKIFNSELENIIGYDLSLATKGKIKLLKLSYASRNQVLVSHKTLLDIKSLNGKTVFNSGDTMQNSLLKSLGLKLNDSVLISKTEEIDKILSDEIDVWNLDLYLLAMCMEKNKDLIKKINFVLETNHSLFNSALVTNIPKSKVSAEDLIVIESELKDYILKERTLAAEISANAKAQLIAKGVKWSKLSADDQRLLVKQEDILFSKNKQDYQPYVTMVMHILNRK